MLSYLPSRVAAVAVLGLCAAVPGAAARGTPEGFADLASKLTPAVVSITTSQKISASRPQGGERGGNENMPQFPPGSPFEEFFKDFFDRQQRPEAQRRATSLGSGFIVDPSGLVITNNHVIEDADEITVVLDDDRSLKAELIGRDAKTDIAVLRVTPPAPLPSVSLGDSEQVRVGDWVMAIGNPFGLGNSVTAGIISARARNINAGPYDDFFQTDAPINRGNSGGPLFNMKGEVIGINTAIFSPSGGSVGIGFAIPSTLAKGVVEQIRRFGRTKRGWLGVRIQTVTDELAEGLGMKEAKGALVADTSGDSPAAKAGIQPGDVIVSFNNREVSSMRMLPRIVADTEIGKSVDVVYLRKGQRLTGKVQVGELQEEDQVAAVAPETRREPTRTVETLGMKLGAITPELREQFSLDKDQKGVLVTEVSGDSPAGQKGVRPGDVIVEVSQEEITSAAQVVQRIEEARTANFKTVLLLVNRKGDLRFYAIRLGDK